MSRHIPASKQKEKPTGNYKHISKDINRLEDKKLITGSEKYIDDINVPGMAHAASLRSPFAHADKSKVPRRFRLLRVESPPVVADLQQDVAVEG